MPWRCDAATATSLFAVCVGRLSERLRLPAATYAEDPYLSGEYATSFVRGFQEAPEAPGTLLAGATCKHLVANSMEQSCDGGQCYGREDFDAQISMRDLVDSYLYPFQQCVESGKAAGLMCSCQCR